MLIEFYKSIKSYLSILKLRKYVRVNYSTCQIEFPITIVNLKKLELGENLIIGSGCLLHCGGYEWSNYEGYIEIGNSTIIGQNVIMYGAGKIVIGENVGIGPGCKIYSSSVDPSAKYSSGPANIQKFGTVTIKPKVRIYSNVVISPGVTIGEGAIIGAGSIVTRDIPPWTFCVGSPAKEISKRKK